MRRAVWGLIVVLIASSGEARHANAGFRVCDATPFRMLAALGYQDAQHRWVSQGWWRIGPGTCTVMLDGPLTHRHFYLYAEGMGEHSNVKYSGKTPFCIQQPKFMLYQSQYGAKKQEDCAAWGLNSTNFIEIDTRGSANYTHNLWYNGGAQASGPPPRPSGFTPQPAPGYVPPPPAPTPGRAATAEPPASVFRTSAEPRRPCPPAAKRYLGGALAHEWTIFASTRNRDVDRALALSRMTDMFGRPAPTPAWGPAV